MSELNSGNNNCSHGNGNGNGQGSQMMQMQQQMVMESKQDQVQTIVQTQMVLEITQKGIKNIRKLGNLLLKQSKEEEEEKKSQNTFSNIFSNNKGKDNLKSEIFVQQMLTGQLLNALRMAISNKNVLNNENAHNLSLLELGKFKQELLKNQDSQNVPKSIIDKLLVYVETMQVILQDYKQSYHIPGPKLDPTTFNQEAVSNGMELFLGSQHKITKRTKTIETNAKIIGKQHNDLLNNNNNNKKLVEQLKNEKIDKSKMNSDVLFNDIDKTYLDIDIGNNNNNKNEDDEVLTRVAYGNEHYKQESAKLVEERAATAADVTHTRNVFSRLCRFIFLLFFCRW